MNSRVAVFSLLVTGCGGLVTTATDSAEGPSPGPAGSSSPAPGSSPPPSSAPSWSAIDAEGPVTAIVTTKDSVCWSSFSKPSPTTSLVACAGKSDGHRTELLRDALVHPGLAVGSGQLYWSTDMTATIDRAPLGGGVPEPVVTTKGPHGRFVVLHDMAYWLVDSGNGSVLFALDAGVVGSQPAEVANVGPSDPDLLAIDEYTAYDFDRVFVFGDGVELLRMGSGESPRPLSAACFYPTDLAAETPADTPTGDRHVYWSCQDGTLHWVSQDTAEPEHIEHDTGWGFIAPWHGVAYVADVSGGRVLRASPAESKIDVLQTGLVGVTKIAVDDSGVYVGVGTSIQRFAL